MKFPDDPSFSQLKNSLAEKNTKEAFRAAHTLKGVAQNLGFTPLYETAAAITEVLRTGNLPDGESMMNAVTKEYERTIAAIEVAMLTVSWQVPATQQAMYCVRLYRLSRLLRASLE